MVEFGDGTDLVVLSDDGYFVASQNQCALRNIIPSRYIFNFSAWRDFLGTANETLNIFGLTVESYLETLSLSDNLRSLSLVHFSGFIALRS